MGPFLPLACLLTPTASADGGPPPFSLEVAWRGGDLRIGVVPPAGEHVAPEAPASLGLEVAAWRLDWEGDGAALAAGIEVVMDLRTPVTLSAEAVLSLCTDDGTACRRVEARVPEAHLEGRRGRVVLASAALDEPHRGPFADAPDPGPAFEAALAAAARDGRLVLLDFGADWCPPCNRLAVELLHDPADDDLVERFRVLPVDADLPASWPLKDRYGVGGYPTVLVVDARGAEVSRLVGYPGEDLVAEWLRALAGGALVGSLDDRLAAFRAAPPPAGEAASRATARLAADLARAGRKDEARAVLALLPPGPARSEVALALGEGTPADVRRALAGGPGRVPLWMWDAEDLLDADPVLRAQVLPVLRTAAAGRGVPPADAADVFALLAGTAPSETEGRDLWTASAALLRATLTGDPGRDRAHWAALADALEGAGEVAEAVDVLEEARAAFPGEFTFHHALARLYLGRRDWRGAESPARDALRAAAGDQRLRAAHALAEALAGLGRRDEALTVLDGALSDTPVPGDGVEVRTHRYLGQVRDLRASIAAGEAP